MAPKGGGEKVGGGAGGVARAKFAPARGTAVTGQAERRADKPFSEVAIGADSEPTPPRDVGAEVGAGNTEDLFDEVEPDDGGIEVAAAPAEAHARGQGDAEEIVNTGGTGDLEGEVGEDAPFVGETLHVAGTGEVENGLIDAGDVRVGADEVKAASGDIVRTEPDQVDEEEAGSDVVVPVLGDVVFVVPLTEVLIGLGAKLTEHSGIGVA